MHTTICNKSYYGPRNINTIHKGERCMWNMIDAYVVLAYVKYDSRTGSTGVKCAPSRKYSKVFHFYAIWLQRVMHGDISKVNYYV